jgi:diguanylate cyclase (GGDEF)-like protein/PAS domain S-box-containing protein
MQDSRKTKARLIEELAELKSQVACLEGALGKYMDVGVGLKIYKTLFSEVSDLAYIMDANGNIIFVNEIFEKLTGKSPADFLGKPFTPLFDEENLTKAMDAYDGTLKGGCPQYVLTFKDTGVVCEYKNIPMRDRNGKVIGVMGIARDITGRVRSEEELKRSEGQLKEAQRLARIGSWEWEIEKNTTTWSEGLYRVFGVEPGEFQDNAYETFLKCLHPDDRDGVEMAVAKVLKDREPFCINYRVVRPDGTVVYIQARGEVVLDEGGRAVRLRGTSHDVTELTEAAGELSKYKGEMEKLVEERAGELQKTNELLTKEIAERRRLEAEHRKLSLAIEQSADLVFITGVDGTIQYVNPTFERVTGFAREEAVGKTPKILSSGETPVTQYEELWKTVLGGSTWRGVFKNMKKDGEFFWAHCVITPIISETGEITNFLAVQEDVTERRTSRERIQFLSHYDGTTGLINRGWFIELLNDWIEGPDGGAGTGALLIIDLDQFKLINDSYGHGMGDEFLMRVGKLLELNLRYINSQYFNAPGRENILCRLSGDEFAVFMPTVTRVEAVVVAEQLRSGLEGFYQADVSCHLTASVGGSLYPDHGRTASELLTRADAAMYRAKELGRNRYHIYSPEDRDIEQMHYRLKWKENIISALKDDRFEAWYQPIMCLREGLVRHYEVLARMRGRDGELILPGPFIDIAERFGLVGPIAREIVLKALKLQQELSISGELLTFCLNISGKELNDTEYLYFLQSKIYETGVDPERIIFEVTETASIRDLDVAIKFLRSLKAIGCQISLDDFGIGFTSFLYLKEMQVDYVKIAGPFIKNLDKNLNDQLFVRAINDVAKGMGIKVIAEFVENETAVGILRDIGVDYAQGYFIGEPGVAPEYRTP